MLKFQYNKTELQSLKRQLVIREKALPILKNKETALRQEVKKAKAKIEGLTIAQRQAADEVNKYLLLWAELPNVLRLGKVDFEWINIAGVKLKSFVKAHFGFEEISWVLAPSWLPMGLDKLMKLLEADMALATERHKLDVLHNARRKTTQKVNLYEKMQIPAYQEAIIKIKRFLEDRENTQKAAQKIVKSRRQKGEVVS